jgi:excisionase family DNA binding protein
MNYDDIPPVSDVQGVATVLGCSVDAVRTLISNGDLDHVRIGRLIRVPRHMLIDFLKGEDAASSMATPSVVHLSNIPVQENTV